MLLFGKNVDIKNSPESKEKQDTSLLSGIKGFFSERIKTFVDKTMQASPIVQGIKAVRNKTEKVEEKGNTALVNNAEFNTPALNEEEQIQADMLMEAGLADYARIEKEATEFLNPVNVKLQATSETAVAPVASQQIKQVTLVTDAEVKAMFPDFTKEELSIAKRNIEEARRNIQAEAMQASAVLDQPLQSDTSTEMTEETDIFADFEDGVNPFEAFVAEDEMEEQEFDYSDIAIEDDSAMAAYEEYEKKQDAKKQAYILGKITPKMPLQTAWTRKNENAPSQYKALEERKAMQSVVEEGERLYGEQLRALENSVNDPRTTILDIPAIVAKYADVPVEEVLKDYKGDVMIPEELVHLHLRLDEDTEIRTALYAKYNKYSHALYSEKDERGKIAPATISDIADYKKAGQDGMHAQKGSIRDMAGMKKKLERQQREEFLSIIHTAVAGIENTPENKWGVVRGYIMDIRNLRDPLQRDMLKSVVKNYVNVADLYMLDGEEISEVLKEKKPSTDSKKSGTGPDILA